MFLSSPACALHPNSAPGVNPTPTHRPSCTVQARILIRSMIVRHVHPARPSLKSSLHQALRARAEILVGHTMSGIFAYASAIILYAILFYHITYCIILKIYSIISPSLSLSLSLSFSPSCHRARVPKRTRASVHNMHACMHACMHDFFCIYVEFPVYELLLV